MTKPTTGEPRLASVASWAVLAASFGLSATTWVALAELAGFTARASIPATDVTLRLAWLMPVAVDGYVVVALVLWMAPVPTRVAAFAKKNTYGAAFTGIAAQSAYHLLHTASTTTELWRVVLAAIVGALPPAVAALAVHMRALIRRESGTSATTATPASVPVPVPVPSLSMAPDSHPPSTIDSRPMPAPITADTDDTPSSVDPTTPATPEPATVPEPAVPVTVEPYPTPATVAARITTRTASTRPDPVPLPREAAAATRKPQPRKPATTTASRLAPSTTDTPVNESDRAQLTLPVVPPDLLAKANRIARQYRTEHGTPINPGQLAVRLQVSSDEAAQALAVLDLDRNSPTRPVPTVNGNRPQGGTPR
jgi:hypothetical protein